MYYRRKVLLHLIAPFAKKGVEKQKLQSLLFLFCEKQAEASFDFVPYHDGCFSFQAEKDLSVLSSHYEYLEDKKNRWSTTKNTPDIVLTKEDKVFLDELVRGFHGRSNKELTDHVLEQHPYYAIHRRASASAGVGAGVGARAGIGAGVSADGALPEAAAKERAKIKKKTKATLFTLGYEGRSIDCYLNELITNNVKLLCDVRKSPLSMKYGFSKKQLQDYCQKVGILYEHIPELGIIAEKRKILKESKDYKTMFREYRKQLPTKKIALEKVVSLLNEHKRIALTCFERDAKYCHRHCISQHLERKQGIVSHDL